MSYNLSRTLFYEFYKSDPNFIYELVEEYRNYKSDPNFLDKSLEEYRRFKASEASEKSSIEELANTKIDSDESIELIENENETKSIENSTETEYKIEMKTITESEIAEEVIVTEAAENEIENEIFELEKESMTQQEFERSLEQFWKGDEEIPSRFTSETELGGKESRKKTKSKFRIPKSKSTMNFSNVKSRYLDVFKKVS